MNKIFLHDKNIISYDDLINFVNNNDFTIDLSETENFILTHIKYLTNSYVKDFENLIYEIKKNNLTIKLNTSGTTGKPKNIIHTVESITKNITVNDKHKNSVWGLCYPTGKMAFYQVLYQTLFNQSTMVNLFGDKLKLISDKIITNKITHLSATPTFYKMLISEEIIFDYIKQVTIGGERSDSNLIDKIKIYFPKSTVKNIYASTEAASLFVSDTDVFKIPEKYIKKIKLFNNKLYLHRDLVGHIESNRMEGDWYDTKDLIEVISYNEFKFLGRENTQINISGFKINPFKVESVINGLPYVENSVVYHRKNSVTGNILCCNIILNKTRTKTEVKKDISKLLDRYEIPSIIRFVDEIEVNENMKIVRT